MINGKFSDLFEEITGKGYKCKFTNISFKNYSDLSNIAKYDENIKGIKLSDLELYEAIFQYENKNNLITVYKIEIFRDFQ